MMLGQMFTVQVYIYIPLFVGTIYDPRNRSKAYGYVNIGVITTTKY